LIFLIVLLPSNALCQHFEPFSDQDIILQSVFTAVTIIDWAQTKTFVSKGIHETFTPLGPEPSQTRIDTMIFAGIISHAFITYALEKEYRAIWQSLFIGFEFEAICHNDNSVLKNYDLKPVCKNFKLSLVINF